MARAAAAAAEEAGEVAEKPSLFKLTRMKLIILAAVLVVGGGAGAYLMGFFGGGGEEMEEAAAEPEHPPAYFFDLPELTVNLSSVERRASFLKLRVTIEVDDAGVAHEIEPFMPRVMDAFQVYLREVRMTDLEGSAGLYRLKEELRRRINLAVHPAKVNAVLFKEILIQ